VSDAAKPSRFKLVAGIMSCILAVDWARSPSVELDLAEDDERIIRCWPNAKPRLAVYYMTLGRLQWIGLDVVDGSSGRTVALSG